MCIPWGGTQIPSHGCNDVSCLPLLVSASSPLPDLHLLEPAFWSSGKVLETETYSLQVRNGGHRKGFMPRNPQDPAQFHYGGHGKEPTCRCKEYEGCGCDPWVGRSPAEGCVTSHSNILAWRILCTEEPCRLQCLGLQRVEHDWSDLACMHAQHGLVHWEDPEGWDEREAEGGIWMGNTCRSMADSCQCMAKTTTIKKEFKKKHDKQRPLLLKTMNDTWRSCSLSFLSFFSSFLQVFFILNTS